MKRARFVPLARRELLAQVAYYSREDPALGRRFSAAVEDATALALAYPFELLRVLLQERPRNVSQLGELTGRAQSNISRSLQLLARYRLIRLVREGREVRPEPVARTVRVDLATGTYDTEAAA